MCHFTNKNCWIMSHTIWQNFASCMHCEDFSKLLFPECSDSQTSKLHFQPLLWTKFCPFVCQAFCLGRYKWKWDWSWPCFDQSFYYVNDVLLMSFFTLVQEVFLKFFFRKERDLQKNRKKVCIKMRSISAHIHSKSKDRTLRVSPPL